jgi:hypothetical protein
MLVYSLSLIYASIFRSLEHKYTHRTQIHTHTRVVAVAVVEATRGEGRGRGRDPQKRTDTPEIGIVK